MLNENQINFLPEHIVMRLNKINQQYLEAIGRCINEIGKLKPTDVNKIQQMYMSGGDVDKIADKLTKLTNKNTAEIHEIFNIVAKDSYNYTKPFFKAKDVKFIPYEENAQMQKYVKSIAKQTVDEYVNLTQHTAFMVFDKNGNTVSSYFQANKNKMPTNLSNTYTKVIDEAVTKAQLGYTDYGSAMRETIKAMADSGIRTVDYATGYSRRLDTAVRQNVLWGIKQCNQGVADITGEDFGADGYEISYHSNPRPSHVNMGGRQYAKGKARTVKGVHYPSFSEIEGLLQDYGCLHFKFSILLGISVPNHSDKELAQLKTEDAKTFDFEGKQHTKYELSQLQRKTETAIRRAKDRQIIAKASGDDILRREEQEKINLLSGKYAKLCKESGLPTKVERMSISGFRKVKTEKELAKNHLKNSVGHDIIKVDKVKLTGEPNTITQIMGKKGGIDRNYYDSSGNQYKQISNYNHGNSKNHPYVENGEHAHDYVWNSKKNCYDRLTRDLTEKERLENGDIL